MGYIVPSSGGASALTGLTDVTITSPADNNLLAYDTATSKFINQTAAQAAVATTTQLAGKAGLDTNNTFSGTNTFNSPVIMNGSVADVAAYIKSGAASKFALWVDKWDDFGGGAVYGFDANANIHANNIDLSGSQNNLLAIGANNDITDSGYAGSDFVLQGDLSTYAPLASPTFTGTATSPIVSIGDFLHFEEVASEPSPYSLFLSNDNELVFKDSVNANVVAFRQAWTPDDLSSRNAVMWGDADQLMGEDGDQLISWQVNGTYKSPMYMVGDGVTLNVESGIKSVAFSTTGGGQIINSPALSIKGVCLAARYRSSIAGVVQIMEKGYLTHYPYFLRVTSGGSGTATNGLGYYDNGDGFYTGTGSPAASIDTWHTAFGKMTGGAASFDIDGGSALTTSVDPLPTNAAIFFMATNSIGGETTQQVDVRRWCVIDLTAGDLSSDDETALRAWLAA